VKVRETVNDMLHKTFGCEKLTVEGKPGSSAKSAKLVHWQTEKMAQEGWKPEGGQCQDRGAEAD